MEAACESMMHPSAWFVTFPFALLQLLFSLLLFSLCALSPFSLFAFSLLAFLHLCSKGGTRSRVSLSIPRFDTFVSPLDAANEGCKKIEHMKQCANEEGYASQRRWHCLCKKERHPQ